MSWLTRAQAKRMDVAMNSGNFGQTNMDMKQANSAAKRTVWTRPVRLSCAAIFADH